MNYFGNNHGDRHRKKKLNKLGVSIFCLHGNHEMRPGTIETYHEEQWHGGTVYVEDEYPNLLFAKDGEVYDLDGQKTIVIGGAYSVDKWYRLRMDMNWFPDEQPSYPALIRALWITARKSGLAESRRGWITRLGTVAIGISINGSMGCISCSISMTH